LFKISSILFLSFAGLLLVACSELNLLCPALTAQSPVHNIDTGLDYATVQEAIDAEETIDGNTITVDAGIYYEHVIVNKSLNIIGADQDMTAVDGNGYGYVISVSASNSRISGFTVQNGERGINLDHIQHAVVDNTTVLNCSSQIGRGIFVWGSSNCTVADNTLVSNSEAGIELWQSSGTLIRNNEVRNCMHGIYLLVDSVGNTIEGNIVKNNPQGIVASFNCNNNTVTENTVSQSSLGGIAMGGAYNNSIYHNNLFGNTLNAWVYGDSINLWDNGVEGNYWGDYAGADLNEDGVGDSAKVIDTFNEDEFPLMGFFSSFDVMFGDDVSTVIAICNSTISGFSFDQVKREISFNVSAEDGTRGFCRLLFPRTMIEAPYSVLVNYAPPITLKELQTSNGTNVALYFTYLHSTRYVQVIPELSAFVLGLAMTVATLTIMLGHRRKRRR
jgi:parallel beta-helix repeat protein